MYKLSKKKYRKAYLTIIFLLGGSEDWSKDCIIHGNIQQRLFRKQ